MVNEIALMSLKERFFKYVFISPFQDCWEWIGTKGTGGYGLIRLGSAKLGKIRAHRASYILHHGDFDRSLDVCHTCDNPGCVRPEHLFLGTVSDNMQDMLKKGRRDTKGERAPYRKLTNVDVIKIRDLHKKGIMQKDIAIKFKMSREAIAAIVHRRSWKHI